MRFVVLGDHEVGLRETADDGAALVADDDVDEDELGAGAEDGLRLLTPRERAALMLRDVEGLPAEEVARRLACSKATVRSHIANARTKFRRYMEQRKR